MAYIGIDPGVSGGLALVDDRGAVVSSWKMLETEADLLKVLRDWAKLSPRAVLEKVHGGIGRQGASGMFNYGKNYGGLLMGLTAAAIPFDLVPPQRWQKALGVVYFKGATQTERKNIAKRRAQQLFPDAIVTHANADALLLAEYARRSSAWGIRPGRGATSLPDPGANDGKKENGETVGQFLEEKGAREGRRKAEPGDVAVVDGKVYSSEALEQFQTASERRRAASSSSSSRTAVAGAPGNGAGPRRKARRYLRILG